MEELSAKSVRMKIEFVDLRESRSYILLSDFKCVGRFPVIEIYNRFDRQLKTVSSTTTRPMSAVWSGWKRFFE